MKENIQKENLHFFYFLNSTTSHAQCVTVNHSNVFCTWDVFAESLTCDVWDRHSFRHEIVVDLLSGQHLAGSCHVISCDCFNLLHLSNDSNGLPKNIPSGAKCNRFKRKQDQFSVINNAEMFDLGKFQASSCILASSSTCFSALTSRHQECTKNDLCIRIVAGILVLSKGQSQFAAAL